MSIHPNFGDLVEPLLSQECVRQASVRLLLTVYFDAAKLEEQDAGRRLIVGWFRDEISAISAAAERLLMRSAILSSLRQLPELVVQCEYRQEFCKRKTLTFVRATRVKTVPEGRRVVRVPGTFGKVWI